MLSEECAPHCATIITVAVELEHGGITDLNDHLETMVLAFCRAPGQCCFNLRLVMTHHLQQAEVATSVATQNLQPQCIFRFIAE